MKSIFVFLILFSFKLYALDLQDWKKSVVKVKSYPCLTKAPVFEGSGLVFTKEKEVFAITSEHVLIHDTSLKICHTIENDFIGSQKTELLEANYEKGLALLKVKSQAALNQGLLSWNDLKHNTQPSSHLMALGYPLHADSLQMLKNGELQNEQSRRALVMGVEFFIEATKLPIEYGMSGGVLLNASDTSLAGLISHQYLKRQAGKASLIENVDSENFMAMTDIALLIPRSVMIEFIENLDLNSKELRFTRSSEHQLQGENVISYGVLNFKLSQKLAQDLWTGSGGADGSGVGGADGSGVGGNGAPTSEMMNVIEVSLDVNASAEEKSTRYLDHHLEHWKNLLLRGQKVFITNLKPSGQDTLEKFYSLDQFFTLWSRDHYEPIVIKSTNGEIDDSLKKLLVKAQKIKILAQKNRDKTEVVALKNWFSYIRDQVLLFENNQLDTSAIQNLLQGENDSLWNLFYQTDFDSAVELESSIQDFLLVQI